MSMYVCVMCYCIVDYIIIITINNFVIQSHHFLGQVLGLRRFKIFSDTIKPMFVKYVLYWLILGYNVSQFYWMEYLNICLNTYDIQGHLYNIFPQMFHVCIRLSSHSDLIRLKVILGTIKTRCFQAKRTL